MPELGPFNKAFHKVRSIKEAPSESKRGWEVTKQIREQLEADGQQVIGSGVESVVIPHGENKVAALSKWREEDDGANDVGPRHRESADTKKAVFYSHKILSLLFPQHFPKHHALFLRSLSQAHMGEGTIREKVDMKQAHTEDLSEDFVPEVDEFWKFLDEVDAYLPIRKSLDYLGNNFFRYKDHIIYLDEVTRPIISTEEDLRKLRLYMTHYNVPEATQRRVAKFGERIVRLRTQDAERRAEGSSSAV